MSAPKYFFLTIVLLILNVVFIALIPACNNIDHSVQTKQNKISNGKRLATLYCQSCHQFPEPSLLDKKSWEKGVLPHMAPLLGIYEFNYQRYPANIGDADLPKGFYPAQPLLKLEEWQKIIKYYTASSPDSLPMPGKETKIAPNLPLFTVRAPAIRYSNPSTSFVKIENNESGNDLLVCDLFKQNLYRFN